MKNVWEKGFIVRSDWGTRLMVEVDGCRYHHNRRDLTLSPPDDNNNESDSHPDNHDVPMATGVMPTLCPRPQLSFLSFLYRQLNKKTSIYNAIIV